MELTDIILKFSDSREKQQKAIFNTIFIAGNKLQTIFDNAIPEVSLKQFMLLSVVRQSIEPMTFTALGNMLGCSRQNIKKLADVLEKKEFITIKPSPKDTRALCICTTPKTEHFFKYDFLQNQSELAYLFTSYSDEEVEKFFHLFMKIYEGIDCLQENITLRKTEDRNE